MNLSARWPDDNMLTKTVGIQMQLKEANLTIGMCSVCLLRARIKERNSKQTKGLVNGLLTVPLALVGGAF